MPPGLVGSFPMLPGLYAGPHGPGGSHPLPLPLPHSPPVSGTSFMIDDILGKSRTVSSETSHTQSSPASQRASASPPRSPTPPSPVSHRLSPYSQPLAAATVASALYKPTAMYDPATATVLTPAGYLGAPVAYPPLTHAPGLYSLPYGRPEYAFLDRHYARGMSCCIVNKK